MILTMDDDGHAPVDLPSDGSSRRKQGQGETNHGRTESAASGGISDWIKGESERDIRPYIPELGGGNGRACDQGRVVQGKTPSARSDVPVGQSCCK